MKNILLTSTFLLLAGFTFSQTTTTDTAKTTTTQPTTKLVKRKVSVVSVKKVDEIKKSTAKTDSESNGKNEEENVTPK